MTDPDLVRKIRAVLAEGGEIETARRASFGLEHVSIEDVLQGIVDESSREFLLHGSGKVIAPTAHLTLPGYATDHAGIAILKAIFSNSREDRDRWTYPYCINEKRPLVVEVMNPQSGFVRTHGYVYLLRAGDEAFRNDPPRSWQWRAERPDSEFLGRIEVQRTDFRYPVREVEWLHERYA